MSYIDGTYHALIKAHMSRIGIWSEQPKYSRIVWPIATTGMLMSFVAPQFVRLHHDWDDVKTRMDIIPQLLGAVVLYTAIMNAMLQGDQMNVMFKRMEAHWKMLKNTSSIGVLEKYAKRGCYLITLYAIYINISLVLYFIVLISPVILDLVHPLNDTRPKIYFNEAEYGVDVDKYYWLILAHGYFVTVVLINMIVTTETIFILLVEHACALFEVVAFNLKLVTNKYVTTKTCAVTNRNDCSYQQICDCIIVHEEAISFAGLIESSYTVSFVLVTGMTAILISATGIQILINVELTTVMRLANFTVGQIFHLYLNSIPGQRLIDHSLKIHTYVYDFHWYDVSLNAQKLLIPILIRSSKPCFLTAGKVYILSMAGFGLAMRAAVSYFMVFAQLL